MEAILTTKKTSQLWIGPMRRFDFDSFDSEITQGLKDALPTEECSECVEKSLGHAMLQGRITAAEALSYLTIYEQNLVFVSHIPE